MAITKLVKFNSKVCGEEYINIGKVVLNNSDIKFSIINSYNMSKQENDYSMGIPMYTIFRLMDFVIKQTEFIVSNDIVCEAYHYTIKDKNITRVNAKCKVFYNTANKLSAKNYDILDYPLEGLVGFGYSITVPIYVIKPIVDLCSIIYNKKGNLFFPIFPIEIIEPTS